MTSERHHAAKASSPNDGSVQPSNGGAVSAPAARLALPRRGEHHEMRAPFEAVTYRAGSMKEILAKADQVGRHHFFALDREDKGSFMQKREDGVQRSPIVAAVPGRDEEATTPVKARQHSPGSSPREQPGTRSDENEMVRRDVRATRAAQIDAALKERYLVKQAPATPGDLKLGHTEYRFRDDPSRVALTESTFRLATATHSPAVARSMVDLAEARGWRSLKLSGNEAFKRMVWREATLRGVKTQGYEPMPGDLDLMRKQQQQARQFHRTEPSWDNSPDTSAAGKAGGRGGGRQAVLAAIEAVLIAKGIPEQKREAVMAAAAEQLAQRQRDGQSFKVRVFDPSAPTQRQGLAPLREPERDREQAAVAR